MVIKLTKSMLKSEYVSDDKLLDAKETARKLKNAFIDPEHAMLTQEQRETKKNCALGFGANRSSQTKIVGKMVC